MSNKATDFLREVKKQTTFAAIAMLVMGILLLLGSLSLICKALGLVMLAVGLVYTVLYFINLTQGARVSSQILFGIALLMLGAIFYFKGGILDSLLGLFFAFALAVDGASKLDRSVALFRSRRLAGASVCPCRHCRGAFDRLFRPVGHPHHRYLPDRRGHHRPCDPCPLCPQAPSLQKISIS